MRNAILGMCFGFVIGAAVATYGWSVAQTAISPGNPYAPGSFNNDTLLYQSIISQDADAYLNQLKARQQPQFVLPSTSGPTQRDMEQQMIQEWKAKEASSRRVQDYYNTQRQRQLDREMQEIRHLELLNAIEGRR